MNVGIGIEAAQFLFLGIFCIVSLQCEKLIDDDLDTFFQNF
jgi:hypothetical protein